MTTCKILARTIPLALLAALIAPAIPASAASHDGPCAADAQKLCPGVPAGGGRIKKCLREHQADLSDACKARIQQALAERKGPHHACAADVEKFCQGVPAGGGKIAQCLKDHAADLSPECQAAWATHRQQHALKSGAASQPAPAQ